MPTDVFGEEFEGEIDYTPVYTTRSGPDPEAVKNAAKVLMEAKRPVIYAGQGVHYAEAWPQLKELAFDGLARDNEPRGEKRFPENHPLSLGPADAQCRALSTSFCRIRM